MASAPAAFMPSRTALAMASVLPVPLQYITTDFFIVFCSFLGFKNFYHTGTASCSMLEPARQSAQ